uniref:Uncharacterized protein n=1 Tax=Pristionchus pacificus TaxID=54126 RepID=A0A2A6C1R1_PRIPA|eukprot:PDM72048.1 hypothetical protein PRIPAC_38455 [Pristionchus pacificus]
MDPSWESRRGKNEALCKREEEEEENGEKRERGILSRAFVGKGEKRALVSPFCIISRLPEKLDSVQKGEIRTITRGKRQGKNAEEEEQEELEPFTLLSNWQSRKQSRNTEKTTAFGPIFENEQR